MIAVAATGLCKRYGRRWALANVEFALPEGAVAMVVGRNGSGKSTLLRVLATALQPDLGAVSICGADAVGERDRARGLLALLGHRTHLYEPLTALENLAVSARFLRQDARRAALLPLLEQVDLAGRGDDAVQTYSAGMRQRLALARVLQKDSARVVLLDEPYGHLDPTGFLLVDALLQRLRKRGATVLMATHLVERGKSLCDEALLLDAGRLVHAGPVASLPGSGPLAGGFAEGA